MINTPYRIPVNIPDLQIYKEEQDLQLENGGYLREWCLGYHTFGKLDADGKNVIWVCHALTANSDLRQWWSKLIGSGKCLDTSRYFVICVNMLGSCYGSTGPRSVDPETGNPYGKSFPLVSFRDMALAYSYLSQALGVREIKMAMGGSCGGHQILEMYNTPGFKIQQMALLVCGSKETPWLIAKHEAQRMALEIDSTLWEDRDDAGFDGLKAARAMAMGGYRTFENFNMKQSDDDGRIDQFSASSYMRYQGEKLSLRFFGQAYWHLSKSLDTHDFGRGRGGIVEALSKIECPCLIIGMDSDVLIPTSEQAFMAEHIPLSELVIIESQFGHDGFLVETDAITLSFENSSILTL